MADRLAGKVALITGGASGQGREAAVRFAAEGAKVALSDVHEEGGQRTMHMVKENGGDAFFVPADVSVESGAREMVEAALRQYGALHVLYNNAGVIGEGPRRPGDRPGGRRLGVRAQRQSARYLPVRQVRGAGPHRSRRRLGDQHRVGGRAHRQSEFRPRLRRQQGRRDCLDARHGRFLCEASGSRKRHLPGTLKTPMTTELLQMGDRHREIVAQHPLGRLGVASDIVHLAVYLAADESAWVTGGVFTVDGGRTAT